MHHALFLSLVMRFYRSAQERGAKPPFNLWKGALALVHGNVASIHLVLVFHKEIMEQRLDVLHIRALFFPSYRSEADVHITVDSTCS